MLYFVQGTVSGNIKIGWTESFRERFKSICSNSSDVVVCLATTEDSRDTWLELNSRFRHLRDHGEWFKPGQDLLDYIAALPRSEQAGRRTGSRSPARTPANRPDKDVELMQEYISYDLGYAAFAQGKTERDAEGMGDRGTPNYTRTRSMWKWGFSDAKAGHPNRQEMESLIPGLTQT